MHKLLHNKLVGGVLVLGVISVLGFSLSQNSGNLLRSLPYTSSTVSTIGLNSYATNILDTVASKVKTKSEAKYPGDYTKQNAYYEAYLSGLVKIQAEFGNDPELQPIFDYLSTKVSKMKYVKVDDVFKRLSELNGESSGSVINSSSGASSSQASGDTPLPVGLTNLTATNNQAFVLQNASNGQWSPSNNTLIIGEGQSFDLIGTAPANTTELQIHRLMQGGLEGPDGVNSGVSGTTFRPFSLGTTMYPKVFLVGKHNYALRAVSSTGADLGRTTVIIEVLPKGGVVTQGGNTSTESTQSSSVGGPILPTSSNSSYSDTTASTATTTTKPELILTSFDKAKDCLTFTITNSTKYSTVMLETNNTQYGTVLQCYYLEDNEHKSPHCLPAVKVFGDYNSAEFQITLSTYAIENGVQKNGVTAYVPDLGAYNNKMYIASDKIVIVSADSVNQSQSSGNSSHRTQDTSPSTTGTAASISVSRKNIASGQNLSWTITGASSAKFMCTGPVSQSGFVTEQNHTESFTSWSDLHASGWPAGTYDCLWTVENGSQLSETFTIQ